MENFEVTRSNSNHIEDIQEGTEYSSIDFQSTEHNHENFMDNVSEWVRRSVLFWNKQDTISIAESSDTEESQEISDNGMNNEMNYDSDEEKNGLRGSQLVDWKDLIDEIDRLQRQYIDPFFIDEKIDYQSSEKSSDIDDDTKRTESPCLTSSFPEGVKEVYSPIYEGNMTQLVESSLPTDSAKVDMLITDHFTDNYLESQAEGQTDTIEDFPAENKKEAARNPMNRVSPLCILSENLTKDLKINENVVNSIKKVQETLLEITQELNNVRRKSKEHRDPNVILCNLLARIQPPVDGKRDSIEELIASQSVLPSAPDATNSVCLNSSCMAGTTKMASDVNNTIESDFTTQFEEELMSSPVFDDTTRQGDLPECFVEAASSVRNLLRRISEEASGEGREIGIEEMLPAGLSPHHDEGRRSSSFSYPSSEPLTPSKTNYDSGFCEHSKMLTESNLRNSLLPEKLGLDSSKLAPVPSPRRRFTKPKDGFESETSTDWSPTSTLSAQDRYRGGKRDNKRCKSTGAVPTKPFPCHSGAAESCPNFSALYGQGATPSGMYSNTEIGAIRKFLTLTSHYFSLQLPVNENDDDFNNQLFEMEDIETIRSAIKKQREDLEEQRRQQEELLQQLGDMLLQLVNLKEEHLSSRQRQAKALGYLKRQLDTQKSDLEKAQAALKDQVGKLEEKLENRMKSIPELSVSEPNIIKSANFEEPSNAVNKGHIIWRITGIARKVAKVHAGHSEGVIVSDPFYVGPYGYKMAAWLYINGRGDFRGKGMSVYVCVVIGEYDAILHWPVTPNYKFTLVDQNPDTDIRKDHVKIRRVADIGKKGENIIARKGGIPRPEQSAKSLIAGFDDFISQEDLAKGHYIVDDTLFLKVEAEVLS